VPHPALFSGCGGEGAPQEDALQYKAAARNPHSVVFFPSILHSMLRECVAEGEKKKTYAMAGRRNGERKASGGPGAFRSVLSVVGTYPPLRLYFHNSTCAQVGCDRALVRWLLLAELRMVFSHKLSLLLFCPVWGGYTDDAIRVQSCATKSVDGVSAAEEVPHYAGRAAA
jgi:hypothetical protein